MDVGYTEALGLSAGGYRAASAASVCSTERLVLAGKRAFDELLGGRFRAKGQLGVADRGVGVGGFVAQSRQGEHGVAEDGAARGRGAG